MTDNFRGDNTRLCESIDALLSLDASGTLVPHGIGGHARTLLESAATRLRALSPAGVPWAIRARAGLIPEIEEAAKAIYATYQGSEKYPWVERGNSDMQMRARKEAMLAASPQQEPGAVLTEAEQASIDAAIYGTGFMVGGKRVAPEHVSIATPPAHGDGEGECTCPSGNGSLRWPCPKHPPSLDTNVAAVHRKLDERSAKGVREYGVTTDGAGLSRMDWLLHLQEELIDGAVYVQAALTARPAPEAQDHSGQTLAGAGDLDLALDIAISGQEHAITARHAAEERLANAEAILHRVLHDLIAGSRVENETQEALCTFLDPITFPIDTATSAGTTGDDSEDAARLPSAQGWLDSHCSVASPDWMRGWDAAREALDAAACAGGGVMAIVYLWAPREHYPIPANANVWLYDAMFDCVRPYQTGPDTSEVDGDYTHWMRINPQFIPVHPAIENTAKDPATAKAQREYLRTGFRHLLERTIRKLRHD